MAKKLKIRSDGLVNISLDPEAVAMLDAITEALSARLGFKVARSSALRHFLKHYNPNPEVQT